MGSLASSFINDLQASLCEAFRETSLNLLGLVVKTGLRINIDGHTFKDGVIIAPKKFEKYTLLEQTAAVWHAKYLWQKCNEDPAAWGMTENMLTLSQDDFVNQHKHWAMTNRKGLDYEHSIGGSSNQWRLLPNMVNDYVQTTYGFRGQNFFVPPYNENNLPPLPSAKPVCSFATITELERFAAVYEGYKKYAEAEAAWWDIWDRTRPSDPGIPSPLKASIVEETALKMSSSPTHLSYVTQNFRTSFWSEYTRINPEKLPKPNRNPEDRYLEMQYRDNAHLLFANLKTDVTNLLAKQPNASGQLITKALDTAKM